jgi:hypothetical protein
LNENLTSVGHSKISRFRGTHCFALASCKLRPLRSGFARAFASRCTLCWL